MAYESISTYKLNSSLNKIDNIKYENINELKSKLTSDQWGSPIRLRIKTALQELINEYKVIQKEIENYKVAADYIKEYQKEDDNYKRYTRQADSYWSSYQSYSSISEPTEIDISWASYYRSMYYKYNRMASESQNNKNRLEIKIDSLIK